MSKNIFVGNDEEGYKPKALTEVFELFEAFLCNRYNIVKGNNSIPNLDLSNRKAESSYTAGTDKAEVLLNKVLSQAQEVKTPKVPICSKHKTPMNEYTPGSKLGSSYYCHECKVEWGQIGGLRSARDTKIRMLKNNENIDWQEFTAINEKLSNLLKSPSADSAVKRRAPYLTKRRKAEAEALGISLTKEKKSYNYKSDYNPGKTYEKIDPKLRGFMQRSTVFAEENKVNSFYVYKNDNGTFMLSQNLIDGNSPIAKAIKHKNGVWCGYTPNSWPLGLLNKL